jgi:hypothetical protein
LTQEEIVDYLILIYLCSSWIGWVVFTLVWRAVHLDRVELANEEVVDRGMARRRRAAAWRNEAVAGIMAFAFAMYATASAISVIRTFEILEIPWAQGLVTVTLLTIGNFAEQLVAWVLLLTRLELNRARESGDEEAQKHE